jgi:hypothetical protein
VLFSKIINNFFDVVFHCVIDGNVFKKHSLEVLCYYMEELSSFGSVNYIILLTEKPNMKTKNNKVGSRTRTWFLALRLESGNL